MDGGKDSEERIKIAFSLVKKDIEEIKKEFFEQKKEFIDLKDKIKEILDYLNKKEDKKSLFKSSIGNEGVVNNQQQSTTINNNPTSTQNIRKPPLFDALAIQEALQEVDQAVAHKIHSLTDREFSILAAIVENETEGQESTYTALADRLMLSESTVRGVVNRILTKGLPLMKNRFLHKKASLSLPSDLQEVYTLKKLLFLRQHSLDQKTLDTYQ